jgi:hypothetical protein
LWKKTGQVQFGRDGDSRLSSAKSRSDEAGYVV